LELWFVLKQWEKNSRVLKDLGPEVDFPEKRQWPIGGWEAPQKIGKKWGGDQARRDVDDARALTRGRRKPNGRTGGGLREPGKKIWETRVILQMGGCVERFFKNV